MAVAPTGAIYKALEFDGVSSRTYGVYITGEAVYNAPERDVEMITIPGRNGSFALDNGRFENITVTYPAGIFAETEADFRAAISDFRNFLCSRKGYVRLKDEYNPNEYRMAVYKSGLEVEPAMLKAGEFEITFDCKPQRWLTSGETAITIGEWGETETATGDIVKIDNPDGTLGIKSLSVTLDPIQDLHGYDKPWSGGAGKNKFNGADVTTTHSSNWEIGWNENTNALTITHKTSYTTGVPSCSLNLPSGTYVSSFASQTKNGSISLYTNGSYTKILSDGTTFDIASGNTYEIRITADEGTPNVVTKFQIESGSTATSFEPYSNICPITGRTECETVVSPTTSAEDGTTYTTALGRTVYGGTLDVVSGELVVDRANIASYNGETLPSTWISDRDVYASGTTPTTGAQVVYELATPQTYQLTPQEVELLTGTNNVWSDSGDITLEYGQLPNLLINPTLFESGPLLEVVGTGDITFNGSDITIQAVELGAVQVYGGYTTTGTNPDHVWFEMDMSRLNLGDTITISGVQINNNIGLTSSWPGVKFDSLVITETTDVASYVKGPLGSRDTYVSFVPISFVFNYGTPATSTTTEIKASMSAHRSDGAGFTGHFTFTSYIDYDGDNKIDMYFTGTSTLSSYFPQTRKVIVPEVTGDSTISTLPTPVYIDLDIGEAYGDYSGVIASVNNAVILPAELPTLASGSNTITFDNTITDLKIMPRWWKV